MPASRALPLEQPGSHPMCSNSCLAWTAQRRLADPHLQKAAVDAAAQTAFHRESHEFTVEVTRRAAEVMRRSRQRADETDGTLEAATLGNQQQHILVE